jgi:hypothetical protein
MITYADVGAQQRQRAGQLPRRLQNVLGSLSEKFAIHGQEMDVAMWALAARRFKNTDGSLRTLDFAVANPLFSANALSSGLDPAHDEFDRFEFGAGFAARSLPASLRVSMRPASGERSRDVGSDMKGPASVAGSGR